MRCLNKILLATPFFPPLPFPPHHNPQSGFSVLTNVTLVHNHSWPALPQKYTGFKFLGYTVISTIKT